MDKSLISIFVQPQTIAQAWEGKNHQSVATLMPTLNYHKKP